VSLRLDGNEGQPPSARVAEVLEAIDPEAIRRYPSAAALEARLAEEYGLESDQVLVTAGGDDALQRMCRAFLSEDRALLLPEPTFGMIRRFAEWSRAPVVSVPWTAPEYPIDEVLTAVDDGTAVIAVVTPNNPTGGYATAADLRRLSEAAPGAMLMVDCAYTEFADHDLTAAALAVPNALVFRTTSKALGLAGLRVGYVMGAAPWIAALRQVGLPYPVSAPSLAVAEACLSGAPQNSDYVQRVISERRTLRDTLLRFGCRVDPSQGNFVFARTQRALWWRDALAGLGIGIRAWPDDPLLGDAMRITCPGDADQFDRLDAALETVAAPAAVLFDIDGVLADVSRSYRQAIEETVRAFGGVVAPGAIDAVKRAGDANNDWRVTQILLAQQGLEVAFDAIRRVFDDLYWGSSEAPGLWRLERFIGDRAALERLATRYPLAAVTGRPRRDAEQFLARTETRRLFGAVVTMEDGPAKPSPVPVQLALQRLGVTSAWLVGDTRDDLEAARSAGVLPLGVVAPQADPVSTRQHLLDVGAARVLDTWMDLEGLLP